jgi:hypothetical protein
MFSVSEQIFRKHVRRNSFGTLTSDLSKNLLRFAWRAGVLRSSPNPLRCSASTTACWTEETSKSLEAKFLRRGLFISILKKVITTSIRVSLSKVTFHLDPRGGQASTKQASGKPERRTCAVCDKHFGPASCIFAVPL